MHEMTQRQVGKLNI